MLPGGGFTLGSQAHMHSVEIQNSGMEGGTKEREKKRNRSQVGELTAPRGVLTC